MALGRKTGGRRAGTPNRITGEIAERLRQLDCDPLAGLVELSRDETVDPAVRVRILIELCGYLHAKRRYLEVSFPEPMPPPPTLVVSWLEDGPKSPSGIIGRCDRAF